MTSSGHYVIEGAGQPASGRTAVHRGVTLFLRSLAEDATAAWRHLWLNLIAGSPLVPRAVRFLVYRSFGMKVQSPNIWSRCTIVGSNLEIGQGTFVNQQCFFEALGRIRIGRHCQVGMGVMVITSHHNLTERGAERIATYRPVEVGDDVWLGARVTVLPGVKIASRSVVAAGAVVAKDIVAPGVYAGVPARKVREL